MKKLLRLIDGDIKTKIALHDLRRMAGDDSDVRLLAEIIARANSIIRALGLDPKDTTADEVYQALMAVAPKVEQTACFKDSDWVLADFDGQIISFHPVDIVENYHHKLPLGKHQTHAGKRGLGHEITLRYHNHPATHQRAVERAARDGGLF
ncbi:hypothetical protein CR969_02525 [Candidatus Saccharibacteria bacterium]|nr:MAG: hypothetical protein CR969_02525 [Candidatus Saccharibacteria bacterium]